jgi:hypothetical protein
MSQRPRIDALMGEHKLSEDQWNKLAFAILRANVQKWEIIRRRTLGDLDVLSTPVTHNATAHYVAEAPSPRKEGRLFSVVLPGFIELCKRTKAGEVKPLHKTKRPIGCSSNVVVIGR